MSNEIQDGEGAEGEEEEPFVFPVVEDPNPWNEKTYDEKGGLIIEEKPSDVERAYKNGEAIDTRFGEGCGDGLERKYNQDYINAKALLLEASSLTGENLYDHLTRIVSRVIETQPPDVVDIAEDLSRQLKFERFSGRSVEKHSQDLKIEDADPILDVRDPSRTLDLAYLHQPLFIPSTGEGGEDFDLDLETLPMPNFLELAFYFHQASTGFSTDELFRIGLSVKKLIATEPLRKIRLWGKILGTEKNYIVIEADWQEGEGDVEEEAEEEGDTEDYNLAAELNADGGDGEGDEEIAEGELPLPVSKWKPPPIIPREINSGVNKTAYYVTTEIGQPWVRLPMVSPEQVLVSRKIKKSFTGDLDRLIVTYPPFPGPNPEKKKQTGQEKHYLRAQIARITAGTHVSPMGYFNLGGEEDEAEDMGSGGEPTENINFQGIPVIELADESLDNWVHHVPYILPQGRTAWFDPNPNAEGEGEDDEELDFDLYRTPAEPEIGPPLLGPISEDEPLDEEGGLAWTTVLSSNTIPQYGLAIVRNNRWPGAITLSTGKKFFNLYVGSGLKYLKNEFQVELPPPPMKEYPVGPEITETVDPTPEEEEALRKLLAKGGEGEGGEGGGEEGEEEDEDED